MYVTRCIDGYPLVQTGGGKPGRPPIKSFVCAIFGPHRIMMCAESHAYWHYTRDSDIEKVRTIM